jgi:hypothetical protein
MTPLLKRTLVTLCSLALLVPAIPAAGAASSGPASAAVAAYLAVHPGGVPIGDSEISYGGGRFIVTLARPANTLAGADCPSGWFCFYDRVGFGYPRGRLSDCGTQDLGNWGWQFRTESAHYNLSSGRTAFRYNSTTLFEVGSANRTRADAAPYRNRANRVHRYC